MTNETEHERYGVEFGTSLTVGGDYEVKEFATKKAARAHLAELKRRGYVTGSKALAKLPVGTRYALAVYLDHTGCPMAEF